MFNKYITFVHITRELMLKFNLISNASIAGLLRTRKGEERIGKNCCFVKGNSDLADELTKLPGRFVVIGIPEDIGVRANLGRGGADTAFIPALDSFLNQQSNVFLTGAELIIAGALNVSDLMKRSEHLNPKISADLNELRKLTAEIDERVIEVIKTIVVSGKIPIIIGGGHNNAYGNIAGTSKALNKQIHVINCDPHADFRALEGRHSGNGFSYAFNDGYMKKYCVLGLHEQYNNSDALDRFLKQPDQLMYQTFEDIFVREKMDYNTAMERCMNYVKDDVCGIELDLDAITNVPSSAKTSSGLSSLQARQYVYNCGKKLNTAYLHISEGAPVLAHRKADNKTGKLMSYLISDFIKGVNEGRQEN